MSEQVSPYRAGVSLDLGFALVALGALVATISTFLPWDESPSYRAIEHNTLIQEGGWALIALALGAAASAFRVGSGQSEKWLQPAVFAALSAGFLLIQGNSPHTLYPVGPDGQLDTAGPGINGSLGIAIYVAWLGVAVMALGTGVLRTTIPKSQTTHLKQEKQP